MRVEQLTFTRFIAAFFILAFHFGPDIPVLADTYLHFFVKHANIGVSYFFILSGFVMIVAYRKADQKKIETGTYYINRFARIYPVYGCALVAALLVLIVKKQQLVAFDVFVNVFAIQSWFPQHVLTINTPAWSIAVEALFYILFPFLFNYIYIRYKLTSIVISIIIFWLLTQVIVHVLYLSEFYQTYPSASHDFLFYFPLFHLNEFLIGNAAGLCYLILKPYYTRNYDLLLLLFPMLFFLFLNADIHYMNNNGIFSPVFACLIILLALNNGLITKVFQKSAFVLLGEISYGMYILQLPVYKAVSFFIGKQVNTEILFYCFLGLIIPISIVCHYVIELPISRWIKKQWHT